jgi:hypothetical protein
VVDNFTLWQPLPGKSLFLAARTEMFSIGHRILTSSKADIVASEGEKNLGGKRDLLSTLLKANLSPDVPANQRLSDRELVSRTYEAIFFPSSQNR